MPTPNPGDLSDLLANQALVAIVCSQPLSPVDGPGAPFSPPTYLGANNAPTYCISSFDAERNLCVVDSVQAQANRIEQAFMREPYRSLVRRVDITATLSSGEERTLDMLQLGHRLADAAVTFSTLATEANQAMRAFAKAGPEAIAKLAPMSLLCGMWESRGEDQQLKIPRAFSATITARDVRTLRRMATFAGSFWSKDLGLDGKRSTEGLDPVPAGEALGGVVATGEIKRTATLNLIALRQNCHVAPGQAPSDVARYMLGLGLVALTMQPECFLRQGCLLVPEGPAGSKLVDRQGGQAAFELTPERALEFAAAAAAKLGVAELPPLKGTFQKERVESPKPAKEKSARSK